MPYSVSAQKPKIKYYKKTYVIAVNHKPHALMLRTIATIGGINNNFNIQSMDGKELLYIKLKIKDRFNAFGNLVDSQTGYEIIFIESGKSVWKRNTMGAKGAMKLVVKNKLIKDNNIDPFAEKSFLLKY